MKETTMSTRQRIVWPLAVLLGLGSLGNAPRPEALKGAGYLMIRGGDLEAPIVLHSGSGVARHAAYRTGDRARLYRSLLIGDWEAPDSLTARHYEVAHFWESAGAPPPMSNGAPVRPLEWEDATAISHIYPDEPGGPLWNPAYLNYFVSFGGEELLWSPARFHSRERYRRISADGQAVLEGLGLTFGGSEDGGEG